MKLLALDLEMNQPSGKIIQIGAAIMAESGIVDTFSIFVNPGEEVSDYITNLTGITNDDVKEAPTLVIANEEFSKFIMAHKPYYSPLTWGGSDTTELLRQLVNEAKSPFPWHFGRRWLDVKSLYQFRALALGIKPQAGLAKALTKLGLKFLGKKHNAESDAVNTLFIYRALIEDFKIISE